MKKICKECILWYFFCCTPVFKLFSVIYWRAINLTSFLGFVPVLTMFSVVKEKDYDHIITENMHRTQVHTSNDWINGTQSWETFTLPCLCELKQEFDANILSTFYSFVIKNVIIWFLTKFGLVAFFHPALIYQAKDLWTWCSTIYDKQIEEVPWKLHIQLHH